MSAFQKIIEELASRKSLAVTLATVDSVDESALVFDCTPVAGGAPIQAARIRPISNGSDIGVVSIPKAGTIVALLPMGGAQWMLLAASEWERLEFRSPRCRVVMNANGEVELHGEKVRIITDDLVMGSVQGAEPFVKGDALGSRVAEIYTHISAIHSALLAFAATETAACAGPLAPLLGGFTALTAAISPELGTTAADQAKYNLVKSQKIKGS